MHSLIIFLLVIGYISSSCVENHRFRRDSLFSSNTNEESDESSDCFSAENVFHNLFNVHQRLLGGAEDISDHSRRVSSSMQSRRKASNTTDSADDDGNSSILHRTLSAFTNFLKPWWQGPNVCVDIEEKIEPMPEIQQLTNSLVRFSSYMKSCKETGKSYVCTERSSTNDSTYVTKMTDYHCCLGYERERGRKGCTKKIELKNMEQVLTDLNLTKFLEVAKSTGVFDQISGQNVTLFVPTNEAFDTMPTDEVSVVILEDKKEKSKEFWRNIILAHVVPGWKSMDMMQDESSLNALQNSAIRTVFYSVPRPVATVNCARVKMMDEQTQTGFVNVIDRLMPQTTETLWSLIRHNAQLSTFASIIDEATRQIFDDPKNHVTVFAFTDESFGKLPKMTQDRIRNNHTCMTDVAKNHIVPYTVCMSIIKRQSRINSMNMNALILNVTSLSSAQENSTPKNPKIAVNGKNLLVQDRVASNGVLHIIDGPLLFPRNQEPLDALRNFGFADLADALDGPVVQQFLAASPNETTFFLPYFIDQILQMNDTDARQRLLLNHVARRVNKVEFETPAGLKLKIRIEPSNQSPFFPGKTLIGCSIPSPEIYLACNAQIRRLDKPLNVPLAGGVTEVLAKNDKLSTFAMLLEASGLDVEMRKRDSNRFFTLLVPTNEALSKVLPTDRLQTLLQDQRELKKFVGRHVVERTLCCNQLGDGGALARGTRFQTVSRDLVTSRGDWHLGTLRVGPARVLTCDLAAQNGLVHVLDMAITPRRETSRRQLTSDDLFDTLMNAFEF